MKKENKYLGRIIASSIALAGIAGAAYFFIPQKQQNPQVQQQTTIETPQTAIESPQTRFSSTSRGVHLEAIVENEKLMGVNISLDNEAYNLWAQYTPISIMIPEIDFSARLPVENGVCGAKTKLGKGYDLKNGRYTYIVVGYDPIMREHKQLFWSPLPPQK